MLIPILIQDQTQSRILTSSSNIALHSFFRNGVLGLDLFNNKIKRKFAAKNKVMLFQKNGMTDHARGVRDYCNPNIY